MAQDSSTILVDMHAISLIALPIACFIFLAIVPKRTPPRYALVGWTVGLGGLVAFLCAACLCMEASPILQVIIPAACLWFVALFVAPRRARWIACLFCGICLLGFQQQYDAWAGKGTWTSAPKRRTNMEEQLHKRWVRDAEQLLIEASEVDEKGYEANWFSELPVKKNAPDGYRGPKPCWPRSDWVRCWHTDVTGLYRRHVYSGQDYWYQGGPLSEATGKIVIKDRPSASAGD